MSYAEFNSNPRLTMSYTKLNSNPRSITSYNILNFNPHLTESYTNRPEEISAGVWEWVIARKLVTGILFSSQVKLNYNFF